MNGTIVRLEEVTVRRSGGMALESISLDLCQGEVLTLLGPNGAGKSTLLHVIGLLRRPNSGTVYFHGQPVPWGSGLLALRRRMATVFQQPLLLDTTAGENVALGLKLRGMPGKEARRRAGYWMERLGVAALADRPARQISGGEAQRVSLARALVLDPEVLLLDEPMADLDAPTRLALADELKALLQDTGTTTVFVTHDRTEALQLSDRVAVLARGRLLQLGTPEEVFNRPATEEVAVFVGVETILPGRIAFCEEGLAMVQLAGGATIAVASELPAGQSVLVSLRPEDVTIYPPSPSRSIRPSSSARNRFPGRVTRVQQLGYLYKVHVECGFPLSALVTKQSFEELELAPSRPVEVSFKATAAHIIPRVR